MSTFCITISVPISEDQHFRARQKLGQEIGDCIFVEKSCTERGLHAVYVFSGERQSNGRGPREMPKSKKPRAKRGSLFAPESAQ